eukprot:1570272-Rhodomonas_salina.2
MAHGVAERLHALALAAPHTEVQVDSAPPVTTGDLKPKHPGRESTGGNAANGQRRQREGSGEGHVASPKKQKKSEKATLLDKATLSPRKLACPSQEVIALSGPMQERKERLRGWAREKKG